jgi:hypothetical protein
MGSFFCISRAIETLVKNYPETLFHSRGFRAELLVHAIDIWSRSILR